jgi:hypothetical protein
MLGRLLLVALIGFGAWQWWATRPVRHAPGVVAPAAPRQVELDGAAAFEARGHRLTPLARFRIEARVLGAERYRLDREAALAPVDLALGWGPMSDERVLSRLRISQGNRFYYYSWEGEPPIPPPAIVAHSANMHMIPADGEVARRLESVRTGQVVELEGRLVLAQAGDGWQWKSSLTRTDSGPGACELVWVEALRVREN